MSARLVLTFSCLALSACGPLELGKGPFDGGAGDGAGPTVRLPEASTIDELFPAGEIPRVLFTSPLAGSNVGSGTVRVSGRASDDFGVATVMVSSGPNAPVAAQSDDGFATWTAEVMAFPGPFTLEAIAHDLAGQRSEPHTLTLQGTITSDDSAAPTLRITAPPDGSSPLHLLTLVEGVATDDLTVASIEVTRNGEPLDERKVVTSDGYAHWSRLVPLIAGMDNTLEFVALDRGGREARASITLTARADTDREPPALTVTSPGMAASVDTATLDVRGSATDNVGVREVKVRIGTGPASDRVFGEYVDADTSDGYATFSAALPVPSGILRVEVRAIDLNGLASTVALDVVNTRIAPWTDEIAIPLRLKEGEDPGPLNLSLDKAGINEVFTTDIQREIRLLELDTRALITDAVNKIKVSCGVRWREDNTDPRHDCSATTYGKDRTPNIPWQRTPEYAMVRLLTMTPANVVVAGTSLENLQGLADLLGIGGGFHTILAETLGIAATREIVSTSSVVTALQTYWMQTHPEVLPGAKLPITLYDSMNELSPLAERFGPRGSHPGLLDPAFPPSSTIMGPNFKMNLVAESNLRWFDGVDLSGRTNRTAKEYIPMVVDTTGPTFDDVLEFDFTDPAKFDIVGLVDHPLVDMRMLMRENNTFVRSCTTLANGGCKRNTPGTPIASYVWSNPRHQIESVLAAASYEEYKGRTNYRKQYDLLLPAAIVSVGMDGNPAGWTKYETLLDLGDPPPEQYLWETILEVAQVALHRVGSTTFAEGAVNVAFSLEDVDVGLTADSIRSAIRPQMQMQRHKLSDMLLGDYQQNAGAVDFYYRRDAQGTPSLYFVAESDPRPDAAYGYARPGFFADEGLATKLSVQAPLPEGGGNHEKLPLAAGETVVYTQDDLGDVYRLRLVVGANPSEITLFAAKKVL